MDRRDLLAALAAGAVAVPGCLGESNGGGDGSPSATPTETPTGTAPSGTTPETPNGSPGGTDSGTDSGAVADLVDEAFVVPELVAPNSPDSLGVYGDRGEQYVVVLLAGDPGTAPAVGDIELVAGGETYPATTEVGNQAWTLFDHGTPYLPDRDAFDGWVVFRLPKPLAVDAAAVSWPGGDYPLVADALAALARPPASFEVRSFDAPDAVPVGERFTLSLTVENTGDADGTFVGAVNRNFPAYAPVASVRLPVAAGERATWERTVEAGTIDNEGGQLRLWLYWRDDAADREVTVDVGSGTPDGTVARAERDSRTGTERSDTSTETDEPTEEDGASTPTRVAATR
ncbi:hypothetical protein [Halosimplex marinum]|uniref:hypothetical protein n=1 Tax=Halosimplex marinum TaxID=3396620 RepID=UPI003F55532A